MESQRTRKRVVLICAFFNLQNRPRLLHPDGLTLKPGAHDIYPFGDGESISLTAADEHKRRCNAR